MNEAPPSGRKPIPLMLQLPPELEAVYANVARISHSPAELILTLPVCCRAKRQPKC